MACKTAPAVVRLVPIPRVWQNLANTLDSVVRHSTYEDHIPTIEAFLTTVVCPVQPKLLFIRDAVETLYDSQGQARIDQIAAGMYLSQRQLDRQFKDLVGISPKRLARLIRFEAIVSRLLSNVPYRFDDLAFEFGYTDAAHFSNDFKAIAKRTPGEFALLARAGLADEVYQMRETRVLYTRCVLADAMQPLSHHG